MPLGADPESPSPARCDEPAGDARAEAWFAAQGWEPHAFQREVWAAMAGGESRLLHATTGSDASMRVKWLSGGTLGSIEEGFIARLNKGDRFVFAGRVLEYVRTPDLVAYVRKASVNRGIVPAWAGGRMPLSSELADAVLALLEAAPDNDVADPELASARPMLQAQARLSRLPARGTLLAERLRSREGEHLFVYPFAGRNVHIGLAQLLAYRLAKDAPNSFSLSVNDYGLELLAARPCTLDDAALRELFSPHDLLADVLASLNSGELAQRRFREIARVAGLVFGGYPGAPKSLRQLQASSSLFYEVFRKYDPANRLLTQAEDEVLVQELELERLRATLQCLVALPLQLVALHSPSPFSLLLMVERLREQLKDRLDRLLAEGEAALAEPAEQFTGRPRRPRRALASSAHP